MFLLTSLTTDVVSNCVLLPRASAFEQEMRDRDPFCPPLLRAIMPQASFNIINLIKYY